MQNDVKTTRKITETLAHEYLCECTQREYSNEHHSPTQQGFDGFQKSLCSCALDENSLSIGRVNLPDNF